MCAQTSFLLQVVEELPVSSCEAHPSLPPRQERDGGGDWEMTK